MDVFAALGANEKAAALTRLATRWFGLPYENSIKTLIVSRSFMAR